MANNIEFKVLNYSNTPTAKVLLKLSVGVEEAEGRFDAELECEIQLHLEDGFRVKDFGVVASNIHIINNSLVSENEEDFNKIFLTNNTYKCSKSIKKIVLQLHDYLSNLLINKMTVNVVLEAAQNG